MAELHRPELLRLLHPQPRHKHYAMFFILTASMIGSLFFLVSSVWVPALQNGGLIYDTVAAVVTPFEFLSHITVYLLCAGIFAGAAFLWTLDTYKVVQSTILWAWIIIAGVLFSWHWEGGVSSDAFVGLALFVIGATITAQVAGIPLVQRYTRFGGRDKKHLIERPPRRYTGAVVFTFVFVLVGTSAALLDASLRTGLGSQQQVQYTLATMAVVVPLYLFQRYAQEEKVIQLGPARSGKTSLQGGLYKSVSQPIKKESPLLDDIVEEHMNHGEFPSRTQINAIAGRQHTLELPLENDGQTETGLWDEGGDTDQNTFLIRFSYVTRRDLLFPKKRTITAIDYPGELLTGVGNSDPLSEYIANQQETKKWEDVLEEWENEADSLNPDEFMQGMSHLVQYADWILFIMPMDDFLENQVHDRPEMIPAYHRRYLRRIEQTGTDNEEFSIQDLDAAIAGQESEDHRGIEEDGGNHAAGGTQVSEKEPNWLGENRYYERDKNERTHPNDYLTEYSGVIDAIDDTKNHNFLWIATMTDLVYRDFEEHHSWASLSDITSDRTANKVDISQNSSNNKIGVDPSSDLDQEKIQSLFEKTSASDEYYMLLARWILEECISEYESDTKRAMWKTFEKHVFPVWFEIGDTEKEFDPSSNPVLNGSQRILSRLNGKRLKPQYFSWFGILSYRFLNGQKTISQSTMGYEILEALKESEVEVGSDE